MTAHELEVRLAVAEDQRKRWKRVALVYGSSVCILALIMAFLLIFGNVCR